MGNIRTKRFAMTTICVVSAAVLFAAYQQAKARAQEATGPRQEATGEPSAPANLTSGEHVLLSTLFHSNVSNSVVGPGYQPLDQPATLSCPSSSGCTIGVEQHVQVGPTLRSGNGWAVCTQVDGNYISLPGCAWQGSLSTQAPYVVGAWAQQTSVPYGDHIVQTFIYTDFGVQEDDYTIIYRIYEP